MKIVRPLWEARRIPRLKGQPANSDNHSDLYTDENPKGTIHGLGFKDVATAKASVNKIKNSGKKHAHKIQAAIAMEQRAKEMGKKAEAAVYRKYIEQMKKKTKEMQKEEAPNTADAMKRYKAGKAGFTDKAHLKAKGLIPRADGTKRKSAKYEDAPANATGSAIPGSGDTGDAFPRKKTKKKDWMNTAMGRKIMAKIDEVKTYVIEDKPKTKFQRIKELMYSYRGIGQYGLGTYVPTTRHQQNKDNPDEKPTAKSHIKKPKRKGRK